MGAQSILGLIALLGACTKDAAPARICDGSADVRLEIRSAGGLRALPEEAAFHDVGWWYLVVDGRCRYWVATDAALTTRTGTVDEAALRAALHHDEWKHVGGRWQGTGGPDLVARDPWTRIDCLAGCDHPGTPRAVHKIHQAAFAEAERLAALGAPPDGPVEVLVIRGGGLPSDAHATWPLTRPIADLARDPDAPGTMERVEGDDATALRDLKRRATSYRAFVIVSDETTSYRVYVRDAVPR